MRIRASSPSIAVLSLIFLVTALVRAHADEIEIRTPDGIVLRGTYRKADGDGTRAALLLHMLGKTRKDYEPLETLLLEKGISTFAFDFRGHGDSTKKASGEEINYRSFDDRTWPDVVKDISPALSFLESHGHKRQDITIVGASIGANAAIVASSRDLQIRTVVLLSPGMNYRTLRIEDAVTAWDKRPMLVMATDGDTYAATTAQKIRDLLSKNTKVTVTLFPGFNAHGTALFDGVPGSTQKIADWIADH